MTKIGRDAVGRMYFAGRYQPGCMDALPWGLDPFDCIVFLHENLPDDSRIPTELAGTSADWIQVAGVGAEALHDAVDRASVVIGRQRAVGDGSPMTSWHDGDRSPAQMALVALDYFGEHDRVVVLVVGDEAALAESVRALQDGLTSQCSGPEPRV